jgi:hypothetical protein
MIYDGELWELQMPEALMAEIVSGSSRTTSNWPTPTCADAYTDKLKSSQQKEGSMHSVNLSQAVNMKWSTPRASDNDQGPAAREAMENDGASSWEAQGRGATLSTQVKVDAVTQDKATAWPSPCASGRGGSQTPGSHLSLEKAVEGWNKDGSRSNEERSVWATPSASEADGGPQDPDKRKAGGHQVRLRDAVAITKERETPRASPSARDWKDSPGMSKEGTNPDGSVRSREDQLARQVTGVLNPDWEECLMCWPVGWTSAEPMEAIYWPWAQASLFVALRGQPQHEWEPPRTAEKIKDRNKRVKAIGNGQDPSAFTLALQVLVRMKSPMMKRAA